MCLDLGSQVRPWFFIHVILHIVRPRTLKYLLGILIVVSSSVTLWSTPSKVVGAISIIASTISSSVQPLGKSFFFWLSLRHQPSWNLTTVNPGVGERVVSSSSSDAHFQPRDIVLGAVGLVVSGCGMVMVKIHQVVWCRLSLAACLSNACLYGCDIGGQVQSSSQSQKPL
ncbi:hypothetical protein Tco_1561979 [Tanacetum coccineum]